MISKLISEDSDRVNSKKIFLASSMNNMWFLIVNQTHSNIFVRVILKSNEWKTHWIRWKIVESLMALQETVFAVVKLFALVTHLSTQLTWKISEIYPLLRHWERSLMNHSHLLTSFHFAESFNSMKSWKLPAERRRSAEGRHGEVEKKVLEKI